MTKGRFSESAGGSGRELRPIGPYVQPPFAMMLSDAEREHAVEPVKEAYAAGRLDDEEFQRRLNGVMSARTRADLVPMLADLPNAYAASPAAPSAAETFRAAPVTARPAAGERTWAVASHALGLCTSAFGPALVARGAAARRSEFVRRQAIEAVNFQLTALFALIAAGMVTGATFGFGGFLIAPVTIVWFVLSCIGAARAVDGLEYRYPLSLRLIKP